MGRKNSYSVVIPLFNKRDTIDRAIDSVLAQNHEVSIIVVDDGSTDGGAECVAERRHPNIELIRQSNHGVSAARNRGVERSTHDLIAFLDADDEWLPEFLDLIDDLVELFPHAGAYTTSFTYVRDGREDECHHPKIRGPYVGIPDHFYCAGYGSYFCSSSLVVRQTAFRQIGGFNEGLHFGEDIDLWGRLALITSIAHRTDIGARYDLHGDGHASSGDHLDPGPCIDFALQHLVEHPAPLSKSLLLYINNILCMYASKNIECGQPAMARELLAKRPSNTLAPQVAYQYLRSILPRSIPSMETIRLKIRESGL